MQGFLNRINKAVEYRWNEYHERFPGFFYTDEHGVKNMPKIMPAQTMLNLPDFPHYAKRYVDQDPTSYYFMMNASPLHGPYDRDTAVELFYDLFHEKLHMTSSYETEDGLDPQDAADKEVLPAALDKNYKDFMTKQMEALAKAMGMMPDPEEQAKFDAEEKKRKDDEFEKKMGFRRDDPDIIDVTPVGEEPYKAQQRQGIEKAAGFQVAKPRKIWYAVDMHIPVNMELGYRGEENRLRGRRGPDGYLREADVSDKEKKLDELIAMCEPHSELWNALLDIKDKFNLSEGDDAVHECDDAEPVDEFESTFSEVDDEKLDESIVSFWNFLGKE